MARNATEAHGAFDRARERGCAALDPGLRGAGATLSSVSAAGSRRVNVAMGGSLHPEIRDLPGRTEPTACRPMAPSRRNSAPAPRGHLHRGRSVSPAVRRVRGDDQHVARAGDQVPGRADRHRRACAQTARPKRSTWKGAPGFNVVVQMASEYRAAQDPSQPAALCRLRRSPKQNRRGPGPRDAAPSPVRGSRLSPTPAAAQKPAVPKLYACSSYPALRAGVAARAIDLGDPGMSGNVPDAGRATVARLPGRVDRGPVPVAGRGLSRF